MFGTNPEPDSDCQYINAKIGAPSQVTLGYKERVENLTAVIHFTDIGTGTETNNNTRRFARRMGFSTDDAGHVRGKHLGGSGTDITNIVPQNPHINRGKFNKFEQNIANEALSGKHVCIQVEPNYASPKSTRPVTITYDVEIDGELTTRIFNNP